MSNIFSPVSTPKREEGARTKSVAEALGELTSKGKGEVNKIADKDSPSTPTTKDREPNSPKIPLAKALSVVEKKRDSMSNIMARKELPKSKTLDSLELSKSPAILTPTQKQWQMTRRTEALDNMMVELEEKAAMNNDEILKIIEFMDFNNSGEVDEAEFTNAVRAAKRGQIKDEKISALMARVDNELRIKQIRLKDLFRQLDSSGDGVLSRQELQYGLNMLCDVSWEQECERRKLRRIANHTRWKEKEEVRDKTKNWLLAAEGVPKEFMEERDFFVRDIATPERFEKFLEVIVSGPVHTKAAR